MAHQCIWFKTELPSEIIDILAEDIKKFDSQIEESVVGIGPGGILDTKVRNSKNTWIKKEHWINGFVWSYVAAANDSNFGYDLTGFDDNKIQYTHYSVGDYYKWHCDDNILNESDTLRKLSIVVQLSDPDDYEGGNLELIGLDGKRYVAPRTKGTVIAFDSRATHRVTKLRSGYRRSIVGWAVGPRWK